MAEEVKKVKKIVKRDYAFGVGRQKEAVARVRLYAHVKDGLVWNNTPVTKDQMLINGMPVEHYFVGVGTKTYYTEALKATNTIGKFAITAKVAGGGNKSQLHAFVKGIADALESLDPVKYRKALKEKGFLTRDARVRERRKVGMGGKARRKKQSPKR